MTGAKSEVEWRAPLRCFPVRLCHPDDDPAGMLMQARSVLSSGNSNIAVSKPNGVITNGGIVEMTVDVRDKNSCEKLVGAMRPSRRCATWSGYSIESKFSTDPELSRSRNPRA